MTHTLPILLFLLFLNAFLLLCRGGNKENTARRLSAERRRETVGYLVEKLSSAHAHTQRQTDTHKNNEYLPSCQQLNMQIDATFMSVHLNTLQEPEGD